MPEPAATYPFSATPRPDSDRPSGIALRAISGGYFLAGAVWAAGACIWMLSMIGDWRVPGLAIPVFIPYPRIELGVWRVAVQGVTGVPLLLTNLVVAAACALTGVRVVRRRSHAWWQAVVLAWAGSFLYLLPYLAGGVLRLSILGALQAARPHPDFGLVLALILASLGLAFAGLVASSIWLVRHRNLFTR